MKVDENRTQALINEVLKLKGVPGAKMEDLACGEAICVGCQKPVRAENQEALRILATADGIWFACKVACKCGRATGFVQIDYEPEE